jgi:protein-tyrosine phosphatase
MIKIGQWKKQRVENQPERGKKDLNGFTDIHQHLIYGIDDDGPRTVNDTCKMLVTNKMEGIGSVIATPHITPGINPFSMEDYLYKIDKAREFCFRNTMDIEIYTGSEILYTDMTIYYLQEKKIPTLADTSYVLVEFPVDVQYDQMLNALKKLNSHGYTPVLAHIERYRALILHPNRTQKLRKQCDVRYQVNCSVIINKAGIRQKYFLNTIFDNDLVDAVASDAHNIKTRPVVMRKAYNILKEKYGVSYAIRITGYSGNFVTKCQNRMNNMVFY